MKQVILTNINLIFNLNINGRSILIIGFEARCLYPYREHKMIKKRHK